MPEHEWVRDRGIVDSSCFYCKRCNIWFAVYIDDDYPHCVATNKEGHE